jgi:hypothetical protein
LARPDPARRGAAPELKYILPDIRDKIASAWHEAEATLNVFPHPVEELAMLGELKADQASVGWIGITVAEAAPLVKARTKLSAPAARPISSAHLPM